MITLPQNVDIQSICRMRHKDGVTRKFIKVTCIKCTNVRWWRYDMVLKKIRHHTFTGLCRKCFIKATWKEKFRDRPPRRHPTNHGYIKVFIGMHHPMADKRGEIYEHRLIMSQILNRPLQRWEHIHHKDGDKTNNSPQNLELHPSSEHITIKDMVARIKYLENLLKKHHIVFQ